ncbi:hypothetical protein [Sphingomonas sp. VNH70]|uniref:hypothetical protein n=1 Tax=Sphingomonas silueang TaxID=3156617 RepID=UPI0032B5763B
MHSFAADCAYRKAPEANYNSNLVDTIILYAKENRISKRQIAVATGIDRARVQRILSENHNVRYEARSSELNRILKAIGMSRYDALVSEEISELLTERADMLNLLPFLSSMLNGLVSEIASEIQSIEGIEIGACKTVHADAMRKRVAKLVAYELRRFFERQEALYADMEQGVTRARLHSP